MLTATDVLVIGAGPGGSTAAWLLARAGWDVLLVDRAIFPRSKTCGDGLTPRATAMLARLGGELLEGLLAQGFQRIYGGRVVAPDGDVLDVRFADCAPNLPPFGFVIPRLTFDDLLCRHAVTSGVRLWEGAAVTDLVVEDDRIVLAMVRRDGGQEAVAARLALIATGASIALLKRLGLVSRMLPAARAARAYYQGATGLDARFEFFFPAELLPGYLWAFPTGPETANVGVGFFVRTPQAGGTPTAFLRRSETATTGQRWLASARRVSPIEAYPIRTDYPSHRVHGTNWLLIGEAAGLANPITGEGIDLALESAALAAEVADAALRADRLSHQTLSAYDRALQGRFARYFRAARLLQSLVMTHPQRMNRLIRQATRHPELAAAITLVALGVDLPWFSGILRNGWRVLV